MYVLFRVAFWTSVPHSKSHGWVFTVPEAPSTRCVLHTAGTCEGYEAIQVVCLYSLERTTRRDPRTWLSSSFIVLLDPQCWVCTTTRSVDDVALSILAVVFRVRHLDLWWNLPPQVHSDERLTAFGRSAAGNTGNLSLMHGDVARGCGCGDLSSLVPSDKRCEVQRRRNVCAGEVSAVSSPRRGGVLPPPYRVGNLQVLKMR